MYLVLHFDIKMSFVWNYFNKLENKEEAHCSKCPKTNKPINCKGGSTSALVKHLKLRHGVTKETESTDGEPPSKKSKQSVLPFQQTKPSRMEVIAELAAKDGFSIQQIRDSNFIRAGIKRLYDYELPQSSTTLMKEVTNFADLKQDELGKTFLAYVKSGKRFSVSFDEWTSRRGRRYCNVTLHTNEQKYCLGVARVFGSLTAKRTQDVIRQSGIGTVSFKY